MIVERGVINSTLIISIAGPNLLSHVISSISGIDEIDAAERYDLEEADTVTRSKDHLDRALPASLHQIEKSSLGNMKMKKIPTIGPRYVHRTPCLESRGKK